MRALRQPLVLTRDSERWIYLHRFLEFFRAFLHEFAQTTVSRDTHLLFDRPAYDTNDFEDASFIMLLILTANARLACILANSIII